MQLRVDHALCSGQGRCYTLSPELLDCDDEGFVTVRGQTIEVPGGLEEAAVRACHACPEDAITVVDTAPAAGASTEAGDR
jgi:ferredoxin